MRQELEREALPPETLEGWFVLHQIFHVDRRTWRGVPGGDRAEMRRRAAALLTSLVAPAATSESNPDAAGWSACIELVGSRAELMLMHLRPTLEGLSDAEDAVRSEPLFDYLGAEYTFLSVTEAGLYHLTAQLSREAAAAQTTLGDPVFQQKLAERVREERDHPFVQRRLYPQLPPDMPYVCFYPMSKRREGENNWYSLTLDERSRLMQAHGVTGRRYAGRVLQVITGAIGLDAWEWGVTLFASDPLEFKKLVTDMRFDEVSARYALFGDFFVGKVVRPEEWVGTLG